MERQQEREGDGESTGRGRQHNREISSGSN